MVKTIVWLLQSLPQIGLLHSVRKPPHAPLPKSRASLSHSSLFSIVSPKKTGSKKMRCFLILNVKVTEIKDILISRIYDELWEDKRQKYDGRTWSVAKSTCIASPEMFTYTPTPSR